LTVPETFSRPESNLEADTAGLLRPTYEFVTREIGRLGCGDVMIEPNLGEVRVVQTAELGYDERQRVPLVQVAWIEDDGPNTAARAYPANTNVTVRAPARCDYAAIRRGLDAATYQRTEISASTVRLIAAHLHRGPGSALYAFAVTGRITERLYRELDEAALSHRPYVREWADALARYCRSRHDTGPLPGWAAERW
jgi:hypothetical protein